MKNNAEKLKLNIKTMFDPKTDTAYMDIDNLLIFTIACMQKATDSADIKMYEGYFNILINAITICFKNDQVKIQRYLSDNIPGMKGRGIE